ncbi:ABC transporter ATP-binding protein [Bifidobacterium dolichotidis]
MPGSHSMDDDIELEAPKNTWGTAKRLAAQLKNQRGRLIFVMAFVFIQMLFHVGAPLYSVTVVNDLWASIKDSWAGGTPFIVSFATGGIGWKILILALLYMFEAAFYYAPVYLMASVAEKLNLTLREQISAKLQKLPLSFFDGNQPGEVLSKVTNDLDRISETMQTGLLRLISAVISTVCALVIMFVLSWQLTLVFLAFIALNLWITSIVAMRTLNITSKRQQEVGKLTGLVEEYYTGRDIIKGANREERSYEAVAEQTERVRKASQKADFLVNCINPLIRMFNRFAMVTIAIISAWMMAHGRITIGVVQAFYQYVNLVGEPITQASFMINSLQSSLASAERTFELLDLPEESKDPEHPELPAEPVKGHVKFEHVRFGYNPAEPLMTDVNLEAKPGRKIAIVGSTGAGKTTLINLLMRFYDINGGKITLDGVDTSKMTRADLRRNFGMVLQDTWLFQGTVAENLSYGRPDATREEIEQAAKAAHADFFIRTLPQGYDTVLDDAAGNLSIGQRQLLTIARVFLANPSILILDEATSSVDTRTEAAIAKAMNALMQGRTSFVIAHRLSTIRDADLILFMDHGDIVEQGNHDELLARGGRYAKLYESQFA